MNYFKNFPVTAYVFGNESLPDIFRDISVYVSIIDEIKDNVSFYNDYYIQEFERADQISYKLYGTVDYYWTFWLMNDKLRERGWPLTNRDINEKLLKDYPDNVLTTKSYILENFKINQTVTGQTSGATGTIIKRYVNLGQLVLKDTIGSFQSGENIVSINDAGETENIIAYQYTKEYNAAHHYKNGNEYVDVITSTGTFNPGTYTKVTYTDYLFDQNDELRQIKVIKPENITEIVNSYKEALRT